MTHLYHISSHLDLIAVLFLFLGLNFMFMSTSVREFIYDTFFIFHICPDVVKPAHPRRRHVQIFKSIQLSFIS